MTVFDIPIKLCGIDLVIMCIHFLFIFSLINISLVSYFLMLISKMQSVFGGCI